MSLATRCPTCGTVFRVVHDQLLVSEGWVRCGRCAGVFNATDDLLDMATGRPVALAIPAVPGHGTAAASRQAQDNGHASLHPEAPDLAERWDDAPPPASPPLVDLGGPSGPIDQSDPSDPSAPGRTDEPWPGQLLRTPSREPVDAPSAAAPPTQVVDAPQAGGRPAVPDDAGHDFGRDGRDGSDGSADRPAHRASADAPPVDDQPAPQRPEERPWVEGAPGGLAATLADPAHAAAPALAALAAFPQEAPAPAEPAPEFLRAAERAARWRRKPVRAGALAAAVLLMALAGAQTALLWRDTLAARHPHWAGALQALCRVAGCVVQPLHRIGQLSVDASGLARLESSTADGAQYRLNLTLRNRAETPLAAPAVELSLTDASGVLVMRKVLRLAELGAPQPLLAAGQELSLQALLATGGQSVDGYTVELFYP